MKSKMPKICCKIMDREYKCGGCNRDATAAYYLSHEAEPEFDPEEDQRLKDNGLCAQCFLEMIEGCKVEFKT